MTSALMPWADLAAALSCSVRTAKRRAEAAGCRRYRIAGQQVSRGIYAADFPLLVAPVNVVQYSRRTG